MWRDLYLIRRTLDDRHNQRVQALVDDWIDEAAAAAVDGNPKRAHYLQQTAGRLPSIVWELEQREARRRAPRTGAVLLG